MFDHICEILAFDVLHSIFHIFFIYLGYKHKLIFVLMNSLSVETFVLYSTIFVHVGKVKLHVADYESYINHLYDISLIDYASFSTTNKKKKKRNMRAPFTNFVNYTIRRV